MYSLLVVEGFDVVEDTLACLFDLGERLEVCPLVLEWPEESCHHCVVVTASGATHGAGDVHGPERLLRFIAGVLTAVVTGSNDL